MVSNFLFVRWLTSVNNIFLLRARKKDIPLKNKRSNSQIDIFMYIHQILRNLYHVTCHSDRFLPSVISFQIWNNIAPYVVRHINVLYRHWKILDLIAMYDPLVVFK